MGITLRILDLNLEQPLNAAGLRCYRDFIDCTIGEAIHESAMTRTRRLAVPVGHGTEYLYLKTYRYRDRPLRLRLAASKPLREAANYAALRSIPGMRVPDVIAVGSRRRGALLQDGFVLTRAVPHARQLDEYVAAVWPLALEARRAPARCLLLSRLADIVANMHRANFYHIDLQWRNLLVCDDGSNRPHVYVLDCVRGGRLLHPVRRAHGRLRDLSSLYKDARHRLTQRELVKWLHLYFGVRKLKPIHRAMAHAIMLDRAIKDHEESR